jgi:hypothetical protein
MVCPHEYPDTLATTMVPNLRMKGAFLVAADEELRTETRERAVSDGNFYDVVYPWNRFEIENVLRLRPVAARNWSEPTTVDELRQENVERGVSHA